MICFTSFFFFSYFKRMYLYFFFVILCSFQYLFQPFSVWISETRCCFNDSFGVVSSSMLFLSQYFGFKIFLGTKGFHLKFLEAYQMWQTPNIGQRMQWLKIWDKNNKNTETGLKETLHNCYKLPLLLSLSTQFMLFCLQFSFRFLTPTFKFFIAFFQ